MFTLAPCTTTSGLLSISPGRFACLAIRHLDDPDKKVGIKYRLVVFLKATNVCLRPTRFKRDAFTICKRHR